MAWGRGGRGGKGGGEMIITIQSTTKLIILEESGGYKCVCRVWEGETSTGIKITALITRLTTQHMEDRDKFKDEFLLPSIECTVVNIPDRLIL